MQIWSFEDWQFLMAEEFFLLKKRCRRSPSTHWPEIMAIDAGYNASALSRGDPLIVDKIPWLGLNFFERWYKLTHADFAPDEIPSIFTQFWFFDFQSMIAHFKPLYFYFSQGLYRVLIKLD